MLGMCTIALVGAVCFGSARATTTEPTANYGRIVCLHKWSMPGLIGYESFDKDGNRALGLGHPACNRDADVLNNVLDSCLDC